MKNLSLIILVASCLTWSSKAQSGSGFGLKGGLNYNGNGDYFESISNSFQNPERNIGYHVGIFGKIGNQLYLKPELVYTRTRSDYDSGDFTMSKLDAPIIVGVKILGPISVFAGPSLQYILDTEFDGITIDDIEEDFSVGLNFGIALNFNKIGIDLRYERGFSDNEATFFSNNNISVANRIDTRPEQLILSFSFEL